MTRVLAVDDCRTVIASVRATLEPHGYLVRAVGALADLSVALAWGPDVVLLDLSLPGADALTLRALLKDHPVCVYSARPRAEIEAAARAVGAAAWVEKGRPLTQFRHAVDLAARRGRAGRIGHVTNGQTP